MLTSKDVEKAVFSQTRRPRGYDEREVDEFLERVAETLRHYEQGGPVIVPPLRHESEPARSWWERAVRWLRGERGEPGERA